MSIFKKKAQRPFDTEVYKAEQREAERERTRINIARTIYSTVINLYNREAITIQQKEELPKAAAKKAVILANALMDELDRTRTLWQAKQK